MREIKLEEGMYVRTQKGIGKVVEHKKHESWGYLVKIIGQYSCYTHTSNGKLTDVIKASHNPIDLIEEGDYVNGYEIIEKPYCYHDVCFVSVNSRESWGWGIGEMPMNEIKSIVTKEQFEAMKYIIEK